MLKQVETSSTVPCCTRFWRPWSGAAVPVPVIVRQSLALRKSGRARLTEIDADLEILSEAWATRQSRSQSVSEFGSLLPFPKRA